MNEMNLTISLSDTTAPFKLRVFSHLLDRLILLVILSPFIYRDLIKDRNLFIFSILFLFISIFYYIIIPALSKGRTIGKMVFKLRTISTGGEFAEVGQHLGRGIIYVLFPIFQLVYGYYVTIGTCLFWLISILVLLSNRYHQAIHDRYSLTYVVIENKYQAYLKQLKGDI